MRNLFLSLSLFLSTIAFSQNTNNQPPSDTSKWLRAFPLTDYMIDLNDSTKLVQLQMPEGIVLADKQVGLLRGVYRSAAIDTAEKGYGRCQLIKADYYYFAISHNKSGIAPKEGDLIYTFMKKMPIYYGQIPKLASHFIQLQTVYEEPLYDRYLIFNDWTRQKETTLIDSMVADIKFTGNYFIENDPSIDKLITEGPFKGKKTLSIMADCKAIYLQDFFDYIIARPRVYAGRQWKIAEIFATWITEGAPTIVKN